LFDSSGEAPVKKLLSQLIREDIDVRVGQEDAEDSLLYVLRRHPVWKVCNT
jgi:hypothetical protein